MAQAVSRASAVLLWEMCTCVHDSLSPKGAKSQQGNAHVALLSSLGYNNESNCVSLLAHTQTLETLGFCCNFLVPAQRGNTLCSARKANIDLRPKHKRLAQSKPLHKYRNANDFVVVMLLPYVTLSAVITSLLFVIYSIPATPVISSFLLKH